MLQSTHTHTYVMQLPAICMKIDPVLTGTMQFSNPAFAHVASHTAKIKDEDYIMIV